MWYLQSLQGSIRNNNLSLTICWFYQHKLKVQTKRNHNRKYSWWKLKRQLGQYLSMSQFHDKNAFCCYFVVRLLSNRYVNFLKVMEKNWFCSSVLKKDVRTNLFQNSNVQTLSMQAKTRQRWEQAVTQSSFLFILCK